eukprot:tig00021038_g17508.t1
MLALSVWHCVGSRPSLMHRCPTGTFADVASTQLNGSCLPCPPGSVSTPGRLACEKCAAGFYQPSGGAPCQPCPLGTFAGLGAYGECRRCQPGQVPEDTRDGCTPCGPGEHAPEGGLSCVLVRGRSCYDL